MKAIYINIDPYLAAIAAWIKGGKAGDPPKFDPLQLAVTVPLGEDVAIYCPGTKDGDGAYFDVDGGEMNAIGGDGLDPTGTNIADDVSPGFSVYQAPADATQKYCAAAVSGDSVTGFVEIQADNGNVVIDIPFTVLVRREQAQGPVDLVDFTPPAAAPSAADIKSALVAAGSGALAGVDFYGATYGNDVIVAGTVDGKNVLCVGGS